MQHISTGFKRFIISISVVILSSFSLLPLTGTAAAECDPTPPPDSSYGNGVHHPTGAEANAFTYDCGSDTWYSQYYSYNPRTNTKTANYSRNYSYDCVSKTWTMDQYDYVTSDAVYRKNRVVSSDPGMATNCPVVPPSSPGVAASATNSVAGSGAGSSNSSTSNTTANGSTANNTKMGMANSINSTATTGGAFILGNTSAGSAVSGDAVSVATIVNLLQSTSNAFGGIGTFTANINGDVNGDFMFDPSAVMNTGPNSTNTASKGVQVNTNNQNDVDAQINNTIDVGARTGDATVAKNTVAGDATSGNATAIVNLLNLINSTVSAGQSFVGTVNINGNLNGDILLPQGLIDQLIAASGPGSNNLSNAQLTNNATTVNNTAQQIHNDINSNATTGAANVTRNTVAGSATTGEANTGVTLLNLTGSNTVGKNNILVFVNVLGKWVGMIVNAPSGSTAASLGGGITNSGPGSTNSNNNSVTDNSTTVNDTKQAINNDINVHATTGNASVDSNTKAGNAKSGNANTAVNIANIENSSISASDWFGVLFINVFGIWTGSFGVNTSAGDPLTAKPEDNPRYNPVQAVTQQSYLNTAKQFASFTPTAGSTYINDDQSGDANAATLGASTTVAKKLTAKATPTSDNTTHASYMLPVIGVSIAAVMLIGERIVTVRKNR